MTGLDKELDVRRDIKSRAGRMQRKIDASYMGYPTEKPFINSDYQQDCITVVKPYPESNREAIMSALKNLQKKIQHLELGISTARTQVGELNLIDGRNSSVHDKSTGTPLEYSNTLIRQEAHYVKGSTAREHEDVIPRKTSNQKKIEIIVRPECLNDGRESIEGDIETVNERLLKAQSRCKHLESELDHMRALVKHAQSEYGDMHRAVQTKQDGHRTTGRQGNNKFEDLEREQLKLFAAQALAENKVRELESRLHEEILSGRENISSDASVCPADKQTHKDVNPPRSINQSTAHVSWDETPVTAQINTSAERRGHFNENKANRGQRFGRTVGSRGPLIDSSTLKSSGRGGRSMAPQPGRVKSRSFSRSDSKSKGCPTKNEKNGTADLNRVKDSTKQIKSNKTQNTTDKVDVVEKPVEHFKISLAELPFIAGKSVGPSHSVNANLQQVIALLKLGHSPLICRPHLNQSQNFTVTSTIQSHASRRCSCCSAATAADKEPLKERKEIIDIEKQKKVCWGENDVIMRDTTSLDDVPEMNKDLENLLHRLMDDYAAFSFERDELERRAKAVCNTSADMTHCVDTRRDIEESLAKVIQQLDVKAEEISIVQRIKRAVILNTPEKDTKSPVVSTSARVVATSNNSNNKSVKQVTRDDERKHQQKSDSNILAERKTDRRNVERANSDSDKSLGSSTSRVQSRLELYKELRRIQSVLKNESTWLDC